tara:strand:+ start:47 stop:457 length:411 start_codon:yes stop_codon:yes gene_type:complete
MAKRLILGENSAGDYGLFVSKPGFDVGTGTNVKELAFTTSDSTFLGNFLMQKNINEDNSASSTVNATITSDSTTLSTNKGNTLFVATGADFVSLAERTNESTITMSKANTFTNRGLTYLKTSESFKVTALGDFFLL